MQKYHKIPSIFKRDHETGRFIRDDYSTPEIRYLKDNQWTFTEKIDGTNIRIGWDGAEMFIGGRTENAQLPAPLFKKLTEIFTPDKLDMLFPAIEKPVILIGEGYGRKIQKVGAQYIPNDVGFILFDVNFGEWWLQRDDVDHIAKWFNVPAVPIVGQGTLDDAIAMVKDGMLSLVGTCEAEGIVARPTLELKARNGRRIITKVKGKDYAHMVEATAAAKVE